MEGLGSGRQLRWLKHAADGRSPADLDRFYSLPAQLATAAKKSKGQASRPGLVRSGNGYMTSYQFQAGR